MSCHLREEENQCQEPRCFISYQYINSSSQSRVDNTYVYFKCISLRCVTVYPSSRTCRTAPSRTQPHHITTDMYILAQGLTQENITQIWFSWKSFILSNILVNLYLKLYNEKQEVVQSASACKKECVHCTQAMFFS